MKRLLFLFFLLMQLPTINAIEQESFIEKSEEDIVNLVIQTNRSLRDIRTKIDQLLRDIIGNQVGSIPNLLSSYSPEEQKEFIDQGTELYIENDLLIQKIQHIPNIKGFHNSSYADFYDKTAKVFKVNRELLTLVIGTVYE